MFYNFLQNLQVSAKHKHYLRNCITPRPSKIRLSYKNALRSRFSPWKEGNRSNWVPGPRGGAGSLEFADSDGGDGRVRGGACLGAHLGLGGGRSWGGKNAGGAGRRRCSLAAAAARFRRRGEHGLANMWHEEHQRVLGEASKASHDPGRERERESSAAAAMVARRRCASREEGAEAS
jgi:hypothetical protein